MTFVELVLTPSTPSREYDFPALNNLSGKDASATLDPVAALPQQDLPRLPRNAKEAWEMAEQLAEPAPKAGVWEMTAVWGGCTLLCLGCWYSVWTLLRALTH